MKKCARLLIIIVATGIVPALAHATEYLETESLPPGVRSFVAADTRPLHVASADLNGDGLKDYILVLERETATPSDAKLDERQRPLLILVRHPDGALKEAARNEKIVYCSTCGGMMGDPFQDIKAGVRTFSVHHYGGSAWRWSISYTFNYSRRDKTWQLVRVSQDSYHASDPDKAEITISTPPKDYGKIGISDFDPDNWKGQGYK